MRVAVLSDTHLPRGSRRLPDDCVLRLRAADLIIHAGDHTSRAALEELRAFGAPVHAVSGNVDEPALQAELARELVVDVGGARIGLIHDPGPRVGRAARLAARFPRCAGVIYGHTHVPWIERHDGVFVLNPGSPTERRRAPQRTMLELEVAAGLIEPALIGLDH